ncbi:hypothetical protein NXW64_18355 [Bacteroides ovatus]|nr:hypothetical protein NXW64_18355 [Bacteroides ovatus]
MNKRVTILLLLFLTSVPALFAQSIEDKRIDVQSKSSVNAGEQLLNTEHIKPELPDEVNKKGGNKKGTIFFIRNSTCQFFTGVISFFLCLSNDYEKYSYSY